MGNWWNGCGTDTRREGRKKENWKTSLYCYLRAQGLDISDISIQKYMKSINSTSKILLGSKIATRQCALAYCLVAIERKGSRGCLLT